MEFSSKTFADFAAITGLTDAAAKTCFEKQGNLYAPALASFVQSLKAIPKEMFLNAAAVSDDNAKKINEELKKIYEHARAIKEAKQCSDAEAWKLLCATQQSPAGSLPSSATVQIAASTPAPAFGFGNTAATAGSSAAKPVFGFGAAPPTAAASGGAAPIAFGFGAKATTSAPTAVVAEEAAAASPADAKPVPKYAPAQHFTGCFFDMPDFWEQEVVARAPLLNLDQGFLERNRDKLSDRLHKWLRVADFYLTTPVQYVAMDDKDENIARVVIKDAERTFFGKEHREKFYMFLYAMYFEFGNYGQAMSYLAGICLLVLNEQQTAAILRKVAASYIPGHWAAEAVGFATSAWTVEYFMKKHFPDVAEHFNKLNFWPDTYLQKILSGLCVHVLRFEDLFVFLDDFMQSGFVYLVKFCLSMIEHFRTHLLSVTTSVKINELYEVMRLDSKAVDRSDVIRILERAPSFPIDLSDGASLAELRSEIYSEKVAPRIQRAPKTETFEPCEICEKNKPIWWNDDLGAVCEACKAKHPKETFTKY